MQWVQFCYCIYSIGNIIYTILYYNNNKICVRAIDTVGLQVNAALRVENFVSSPYIAMTGSPPSTSGSACSLGGYAGGVYNIKCCVNGGKRSIGTASSSWT